MTSVVEGSWQCMKGGNLCPVRNWTAFRRVCNSTKRGCPRGMIA